MTPSNQTAAVGGHDVKFPKKPGVWWAALDDSYAVTEVVLIEVSLYRGTTDFSEGFCFRFLDGSGRDGATGEVDMRSPIIQPGWDIVLACRGRSLDDQVQVTWISEVKRPRNAPRIGTPCAALQQAEAGDE